MYLSKLTLHLGNRRVLKELANCYELHRTIMKAYSANFAQEERILFRLENGDDTAARQVLVQSTTMPDWQVLPPLYLVEPAQVKPYTPVISTGQVLTFRLLANPTKRITLPAEERGAGRTTKRVRLCKDEEHIHWLERKAAVHGFRLIGVRSTEQPDVIGYSRKGGSSGNGEEGDDERPYQKITFQAVLFDGVLEVSDAQIFCDAVKNGIGPAKGFGFGLLSLAKAV